MSDPTRRVPVLDRGKKTGISYRVRKDGTRTYAYWNGKGFTPCGHTIEEAKAAQAEFRLNRAQGASTVVPLRVTFGEVSKQWLAEHAEHRLRSGTLNDYRSYLRRLILPKFGKRPVAAITPHEVAAFVKHLQAQKTPKGKAVSQSYVANTLKPLSQVFEWAIFKGYLTANPVKQLPGGYRPTCAVQREHREWTTKDVDRLIAVARELDKAQDAKRDYYGLMIEVLLRTGLRVGELLALRFGDVDFEASVITVSQSWNRSSQLVEPKTKASTGRRVPLTSPLLSQLAARSLDMDADNETFVFARKKGENPPSQSKFRVQGWKPAVEAAGLTDGPKVTPHDARHGFTSQLADIGISSGDLAPILGHTSAGITEAIYTHAFNREEREERIRKAMESAQGVAA